MRDFAASSNDALGDFGIAVDRLGEKLPLIGGFFDRTSTDIVQAMDDAGVSFYEFTRAVESAGLQGVSDFNAKLQESLDTGRISEEQFNALSEAVREYGVSADDARQSQALLNVDQAEANALLAELVKKQAPLEQFTDQWKTLFDDMSDGTIDTKAAADAINFLADALGLTQEKVIELRQGQARRGSQGPGQGRRRRRRRHQAAGRGAGPGQRQGRGRQRPVRPAGRGVPPGPRRHRRIPPGAAVDRLGAGVIGRRGVGARRLRQQSVPAAEHARRHRHRAGGRQRGARRERSHPRRRHRGWPGEHRCHRGAGRGGVDPARRRLRPIRWRLGEVRRQHGERRQPDPLAGGRGRPVQEADRLPARLDEPAAGRRADPVQAPRRRRRPDPPRPAARGRSTTSSPRFNPASRC